MVTEGFSFFPKENRKQFSQSVSVTKNYEKETDRRRRDLAFRLREKSSYEGRLDAVRTLYPGRNIQMVMRAQKSRPLLNGFFFYLIPLEAELHVNVAFTRVLYLGGEEML